MRQNTHFTGPAADLKGSQETKKAAESGVLGGIAGTWRSTHATPGISMRGRLDSFRTKKVRMCTMFRFFRPNRLLRVDWGLSFNRSPTGIACLPGGIRHAARSPLEAIV